MLFKFMLDYEVITNNNLHYNVKFNEYKETVDDFFRLELDKFL